MYFFVQSVLSRQLYKSCPVITTGGVIKELIDIFCRKTSTSEGENWVIAATRQPPGARRRGRGGALTEVG